MTCSMDIRSHSRRSPLRRPISPIVSPKADIRPPRDLLPSAYFRRGFLLSGCDIAKVLEHPFSEGARQTGRHSNGVDGKQTRMTYLCFAEINPAVARTRG